MYLEIGDAVIHWSYGPGTVIAIEEKFMAGIARQYYVVNLKDLKIWVPVEEAIEGSLRAPSDGSQFNRLFEILRLPGEILPDQNLQRRDALSKRMYKSSLEGLCHIIRDLTDRARQIKPTENDKTVLNTAKRRLLDEWVLALNSDRTGAQRMLESMLEEANTL